MVQHYVTKFHPSSNLPMLVTELMDTCLEKYYTRKSICYHCNEFHGCRVSTKISFSFDIASALAYLHAEYLIHRDLCSVNILLVNINFCMTPTAKISDFGMSRIINLENLSRSLTGLGHTG